MRVERIEIEGDGPLSGVFVFPADGLGIWIAPNDISEGALLEAVACALYGPDPWSGDVQIFTRVLLQLRRDDGGTIAIDRSLLAGLLELSGDGAQALAPEEPGNEFGWQLLGLGRADFLLTCGTCYQDLRSTTGHARLARLLSGGPSAEPETDREVMAPSAEAREATPTGDPLDFTTRHSRFENPRGFPEAQAGSTASHVAVDELRHTAPPASTFAPALETGSPAQRLRELRHRLADAEQKISARSEELHRVSEKRDELHAERARLGLLADVEPTDLGRLSELAELLVTALRRKDELARDQAAFEKNLASQELDLAGLRELEKRFGSLSDPDREFLTSAEQATAIRRGNLALTRSECRLDDTRIQEIERARAGATRAALIPLAVAAAGLFSSLATLLFHSQRIVSGGLLLAGMAGGGAAAWTFWRARTLREDERVALLETLERKRSQMAALETEGQEADRHITLISGRLGIESARTLRRDWQQWTAASPAVRELGSFTARAAEIDDEIIGLQGKLGAFRGEAQGEVNVAALQAMIDDYRRSFAMRSEIGESDGHVARIEAELTALESERSDVRMWIDAMLVDAGIDPARDLNEAVEMFALRNATGGAEGPPPEAAALDAPHDSRVAERVAEPAPSEQAFDTSWTPRVSATAEAILRRFLPEARDLEVDGQLGWRLRLDPRGPQLAPGEVERNVSSAIVDQVCLALRLAIVETLSSTRERLPVFLDEPWARADDARHARGMEFLVEDLATRGQVVLRTSHEVRSKWFLHQSPALRSRIVSVGPFEPESAPHRSSDSLSSSSSRP